GRAALAAAHDPRRAALGRSGVADAPQAPARMARRREPRGGLTGRPSARIMVLLMTHVTVRMGGVVALALIAAGTSGCRSRPLGAGDSGTISPDAGSAADWMVDGAADQTEPRSLGEPCDHATECESGICAAARIGPHGICCSTACDGSCA